MWSSSPLFAQTIMALTHNCSPMARNGRRVGYTAGILAAAFYGLNPLFALPLFADGMDAWSTLLFRYLLSVPLLGTMLYRQDIDLRINKREACQLFLLSILMAGSSLLLYLSYNYMSAGIASTILFVYPILTALLMAIVFGERMHWSVGLCLALATLGIAILSGWGDKEETHVSLTGVVLVLFSALAYALYLIYIGRGCLRSLPSAKITFYILAMGCALLIAGVCAQGHLTTPHGWHWGYSLGAAIFPTALSLALTGVAIQHIGSTETAILGALEPITAVFVGVTVFSEVLTPRSVIGILLIVVAVTIVVSRGKGKT
ncbi:MAG TPA: EamA family transporter [Prevotellaceae bacterium]|nr:EamA family transporter [Prevotellaceae bacterium]HBE55116.1 EamA family transporter [Prevotellaceae bacterium]